MRDLNRGSILRYLASADPPAPVSYMCNEGLKHLVVGQEVVDGVPGTFCKWTACGKHDVPSDPSPWAGFPPAWVTCPDCRKSAEFKAHEKRLTEG